MGRCDRPVGLPHKLCRVVSRCRQATGRCFPETLRPHLQRSNRRSPTSCGPCSSLRRNGSLFHGCGRTHITNMCHPQTNQQIGQPDAGRSECRRCRCLFATTDLKEASVPSLVGLMSATDVELDDHEPPPVLIDRQLYCRACRFRINVRRGVLALVIAGLAITSTSIAAILFGW